MKRTISAVTHMRLYPAYLRMLTRAFSRPLVGFIILMGNLVWLTASMLFFHLEAELNPNVHTYGDALWWGLSTLTTVGFGDIVPVTDWGRVVGGVLMLSGNFFFVSVSGIIFTTLWTQAEEHWQQGQRRITIREHEELMAEVRGLREEIEAMRREQ